LGVLPAKKVFHLWVNCLVLLGAGCAGDVPARIGHNWLESIELQAQRIRVAQVAPL